MKKRIIFLTVAAILFAAGAAMAHGSYGRGHSYRYDGWNYGPRCSTRFVPQGYGPQGYGHQGYGHQGYERQGFGPQWDCYWNGNQDFRTQMPQDMRDKLDQSWRILADLRIEMNKTPVNKTKVLALRDQHDKLRKDISDWHFRQSLDNPQRVGPPPGWQ